MLLWLFFRGAIAPQSTPPKAHLRGQVRVGYECANPKDAQGHSFKAVVVGQNAGLKLGKQKWVCGNASSLTNLGAVVISSKAIAGARKAERDAVVTNSLRC